MTHKVRKLGGMERNAVECHGIGHDQAECNGLEWKRTYQNGMNGTKWRVMPSNGMEQNGMQ